jgi:GntR family transcriptional regulator
MRQNVMERQKGSSMGAYVEPNRPTGVPQYLVVAETIQGWITSGRYKAGDAIATVNDLATQFGVGRGTIQEALKELSSRGIIVTSRGRRSTVRQAPQLRPVFAGMDLGDILFVDAVGEDKGKILSINSVKPDSVLRKQFDFGSSEELTEYRSIGYLNDRPNAFIVGYLPKSRGGIDEKTSSRDFRARLQKIFEAAKDQERRISALPADYEIARHLDIPLGTPIIRYRCIIWHRKRQLDLYFEAFLRSDGCEYRLDA